MTCKLDNAGISDGQTALVLLRTVVRGDVHEQITTVKRKGATIKTTGKWRIDVTKHFVEHIDL